MSLALKHNTTTLPRLGHLPYQTGTDYQMIKYTLQLLIIACPGLLPWPLDPKEHKEPVLHLQSGSGVWILLFSTLSDPYFKSSSCHFQGIFCSVTLSTCWCFIYPTSASPVKREFHQPIFLHGRILILFPSLFVFFLFNGVVWTFMCEVIIIFNDNIHVYFILGNCWWAIINSENSWQVGLGWLATSCSPSDHKQLPLYLITNWWIMLLPT